MLKHTMLRHTMLRHTMLTTSLPNETALTVLRAAPGRTTGPRMAAWIPLLLSLPALIPLLFARYHAWARGLAPTAFIQYDQPAYVAMARQHFLNGFHLTYANPYALYGSPAIYFQPHLFLIGMMQWAGVTPDLAWLLFGLGAMAFASLAAARLYEEWVGWNTTAQKLGFICFFWGGGMLSLGGCLLGLFTHSNLIEASLSIDPGQGWWMLNFGRNLVYPQEAYYHALFLTAILLLIRGRFGWTLATAAVLSLSHPFTGLSLALILIAYSGLELGLRSGAASPRLLLGSCALAAAHVGYYMVFLDRFPDHHIVRLQFEQNWPYPFWALVLGLYFVGILAFGQLTRVKNLVAMVAQPRMRLCLVWFAIILALSQHDLVMKPKQPIHFAHGYDWIAVFLMAAPALIPMIEKLLALRPAPWRIAAIAAFFGLFLSDNLLWMASFRDPAIQRFAISLTPDQQGILNWLATHPDPSAYVASVDEQISYLTATYANMRAWRGHMINTPWTSLREDEMNEALSKGVPLPSDRTVYYIPKSSAPWTPPLGALRLYDNPTYVIWRVDPAAPAPAK
jgi:hypothetical protein